MIDIDMEIPFIELFITNVYNFLINIVDYVLQ